MDERVSDTIAHDDAMSQSTQGARAEMARVFSSSLFARMEAKQKKLRLIPPLLDHKTGRAFFHQALSEQASTQPAMLESSLTSLFDRMVKAQEETWYLDNVSAHG